jgi:hypothetical protein
LIPERAGAPAAELHLIGTLAQDPDGPERLAGLLAELRPDAVAVEACRPAFERQRDGGAAARRAALAAIRRKGADRDTLAFWRRRLETARLHFEAFGAAAYAAAAGVPLHFLGEDDGAAGTGDGVGDFRQAEGRALAALAAHDWPAAYRADYARARADLEAKACLEFLLPPAAQPAFRVRDGAMAARLRVVLAGAEDAGAGAAPAPGPDDLAPLPADPRPRRVALVCALTHLYFSEARLTVYSQLYEATTGRYLADGIGAIRDHPIVLPWSPASAEDAVLQLRREGRPARATAPAEGRPLPAHQLAVPAEQGLRADGNAPPLPSRHAPAQRSEHESIRRVPASPPHLSSEHPQLVPRHCQVNDGSG